MNNIRHIDIMDDTKEWLTKPFVKTDEGYLQGTAIVTNIGVFTYRDFDNNIRRELRLPEEICKDDSIITLQMKPVTNNHPEYAVDVNNIKEHEIGMTGSMAYHDAYAVSVPLVITDKKAIEDIDNGKKALSCGYTCDLEFVSGVWMGVNYDCIQRNIKYNHIALVDRGRAGDLAMIRMDSVDNPYWIISNNKKDGEIMADMKKLTIDGVEYQGEAKLIETIHTLTKDVAAKEILVKDVSDSKTKIEAERDTLKVKLDEASKKITELETLKLDDSKLQIAIQSRLAVLDSAKSMGAEVTVDMSEIDMKKKVIAKVLPTIDLTSKTDVYIDAMFDACKETYKKTTVIDNAGKTDVNTEKKDSIDEMRNKYIEDLKNSYKESK